jgi:parallel beta helix pectate lyase-like protein
MSRTRILGSLVLLVVILGAAQLLALTYEVGGCKPGLKNFQSITAALSATPPPTIVEVCPGRYLEQVVLTYPVRLEGISSNNGEQAILVSPPNGMVVNATDAMGDEIAAQLYVEVNPGPINISNLTFDASNNEVSAPAYVVGIFVQDSNATTINHVVTQNQIGGDGGIGIWMQGGDPTAVENSSIHDFSDIGIWTQGAAGFVIQGNFVNGETASGIIAVLDVALGNGSTNTVSDNYLAGGQTGISVSGGASGTVAHNNLITDGTAIAFGRDGNTGGTMSVTNNDIFYSSEEGIVVSSGLPAVQHNTITHTPIGLDFACNGDDSMKLNTIMDAGTGEANLPVGFASTNSFFNVQTISGGSCGG